MGEYDQTKRQRLGVLRSQLANDRAPFESQWQDLSDYISPWSIRLNTSDRGSQGEKRPTKIFESTATSALNTLGSGMMSGITSKARPWFSLSHADADLADRADVKRWLDEVSSRMRQVFAKSNFYLEMANLYPDVALYATSAMSALWHPTEVSWFKTFPVGSYWLGVDADGRPNTFVRQFQMTVRQLAKTFGEDALSEGTLALWKSGQREKWVDVCHTIEPNPDADDRYRDSKYKRWSSCYYEVGSQEDKYLRESGFDDFPILAPRWKVTGEDVYGTGPGWDILPDVRGLQAYEKMTATAVAKQVNPPMVGPSSLINQAKSLIPGGVTYLDGPPGSASFYPAQNVNFDVKGAEFKVDQIRTRINRGFFTDLFLMLSNDTRNQPATAREIAERHEEKLLILGPVLERFTVDVLDPVIDLVFSHMLQSGLVPPAPQEIAGQPLKVEYISILMQAQKMVSTASIERFAQFVGGVGAVMPEALDKINVDETVDAYGDAVGVSPRIIRSDDEVAQIRQNRAAAQQQQQQAMMAQQMAETGKTLAETPTDGSTALTGLAGALSGGA